MTEPWRHEPRWPADTPDAPRGPGPGRWRDGPGGGESKAAHIAAWVARISARLGGGHHQGLMSHGQVASYLGRTDYEVTGRAGGQYGSVEFRRYSDGRMLAHKRHDLGLHDPSETNPEQEAEIEASLVGRALGARVPAVVRDPAEPNQSILMDYLPDDMPTTDDGSLLARRRALRGADTPESHLLGLMDAVIDNHDRHVHNVRMHEGTMAGIDHGGAFRGPGWRGSTHDITTFKMASSGSRLASKLFEVQMHRGQSRIAQAHYSKAAIQEARRRIEAVKDELRPETWAGVDRALSVIEDASGSRGASLD